MFLSDQTLGLLLALDAPTDQKIALLRSMWDDEDVAKRAALPAKRQLPSDWSEIRLRVFARDRGICRYCSAILTPAGFHVDHIYPLSRGGTNEDENLCVACPPCNLAKKDSTPEEWAARK